MDWLCNKATPLEDVLYAGREAYPRVLALLIDRYRWGRKRGVSEYTDWNNNDLFFIDAIPNCCSAHRAEEEVNLTSFVSDADVLSGFSFGAYAAAWIACLSAIRAARSGLACQAVTQADP